ncbi:MAG: HEPN domain-containing protein [Deltaproteobacteria bacterium]|nr:HEPN domain-containing protein [Deltaproteobacteria bacterium]
MTLPEKQLALARAWLEKAQGDVEAARAAMDNLRVPAWVIGFHLQQAIEKAWKGRLVLVGVRPPAVHDLRALLQAREPAADPPPEVVPVVEVLQPFAVEERYPLLSPREADRAELQSVLPNVEREVDELRDAIRDRSEG